MTKNCILAYGLLLVVVCLLLSLALLPGRAYARYETVVGWNTVIPGPINDLVYGPQLPVLTPETPTLHYELAQEVEHPKLTLEKLTPDGFMAYDGTLTATLSGYTVTVAMGDHRPPAGTYRLVLNWETEGAAEIQTTAVTFFINYSDV